MDGSRAISRLHGAAFTRRDLRSRCRLSPLATPEACDRCSKRGLIAFARRPSGRRPLSAAIEMGHYDIARLLLERGADPNWEEPDAPKGRALHAATRACELWLVELLLAHGADPNSGVDSSGNALFAAGTPEIKRLLESYGATSDPYDISWLADERADVRRLVEGPQSASRLGAAFTMIAGSGRADLLARLLDAGLRIPPVITGCQGYLLTTPVCFARSSSAA